MSPREANSFVGQEWGLWSGGRGTGAPHAKPGRWPTTGTLWELVLSRGIEGDSVSLSAVSITALLTRPPCCRHSAWGDRYVMFIPPKGKMGTSPQLTDGETEAQRSHTVRKQVCQALYLPPPGSKTLQNLCTPAFE